MRGRIAFNVALALVILGLGVLLWLDADTAKTAAPITALKPEKIKNIEIHFPNAATLKLVRSDGHWRITAPVKARAETSEIKPILRVATAVPTRSYPASEMNLAEIGLDKPKQILHLNGVEIALGGSEPLHHNRYAKVKDKVYLIENPIKSAIDSDYTDLVALAVLPENSKITRLQTPKFTLTPTDKGGWQVSPKSEDKGADDAQWTIDAWQDVQALWIKPADTKQKSQGDINVQTADGTTHKLQLIARKPQLVLRDPAVGVDYHVSANQAAPLIDMKHPHPKIPKDLKSKPDITIAPAQKPAPTPPKP